MKKNKRDLKAQPSTPRAVRYHRVSTDDQVETQLGLDSQREATQSMCIYKGWDPVGTFEDEGVSGRKESRPGLDGALEMLTTRKADILVVKALDRISRSSLHFLKLMAQADADGWDVAIRDLDLDTHSESGRMVLTILAAIAEWEVAIIRKRTKAALKSKKDRGEPLGAKPMDDAIAVKIMDLRQAGLTYAQIATKLNADHVPPPKRGSRWHDSTVRYTVLRMSRIIP